MKRLTTAVPTFFLLGAFEIRAHVPQVLGVWDLDVVGSSLPAQTFPTGIKSEIRSYARCDDGYLIVLAVRVNGKGAFDFIQVAAKSDGKDNPQYQSAPLAELQIHGTAAPFTYSEKITNENTAEVIAKVADRVTTKALDGFPRMAKRD